MHRCLVHALLAAADLVSPAPAATAVDDAVVAVGPGCAGPV
jgi:hypothetical protein